MNNRYLQFLLRACFLILIPLVSMIHFTLNRYSENLHSVKIFLDDMIPYNKFFILPYVYWFAYVGIVLIYLAATDYKNYFRLLASIVTGMFICFIFYYFYQTTVIRPDIHTTDVFNRFVDYVYSKDNPYNCFPSIHVLDALLVSIFLYKVNKNIVVRVIAVASFVSITLSTFFVKQHYVLDAAAAIAISIFVYWLYTNEYILSKISMKWVPQILLAPKTTDAP